MDMPFLSQSTNSLHTSSLTQLPSTLSWVFVVPIQTSGISFVSLQHLHSPVICHTRNLRCPSSPRHVPITDLGRTTLIILVGLGERVISCRVGINPPPPTTATHLHRQSQFSPLTCKCSHACWRRSSPVIWNCTLPPALPTMLSLANVVKWFRTGDWSLFGVSGISASNNYVA